MSRNHLCLCRRSRTAISWGVCAECARPVRFFPEVHFPLIFCDSRNGENHATFFLYSANEFYRNGKSYKMRICASANVLLTFVVSFSQSEQTLSQKIHFKHCSGQNPESGKCGIIVANDFLRREVLQDLRFLSEHLEATTRTGPLTVYNLKGMTNPKIPFSSLKDDLSKKGDLFLRS